MSDNFIPSTGNWWACFQASSDALRDATVVTWAQPVEAWNASGEPLVVDDSKALLRRAVDFKAFTHLECRGPANVPPAN